MGLKKIQLAVIAQTNRDNYSIEIRARNKNEWIASIKIKHPASEHEIVTSKGVPKTWRNVGDALEFIQEVCKDCKDVSVKMGNWTLIGGLQDE